MKTLTKNGLSISLLEDNVSVTIGSKDTIVGDPTEYILSGCNNNNTVLHEGVTAPDDWAGSKYTFDGTTWELNPKWRDPNVVSELEVAALRDRRNKLLAETDWVVIKEVEKASQDGLGLQIPLVWLEYRQALRDITDHPNWPKLTYSDWPTKP